MRFASPWAFLLLALIPVVIALHFRRGRTGTVRFSSLDRIRLAPRSLRLRFIRLPLFIRVAVLALAAAALARPQTSTAQTKISTEGIAMEMVVDRSGSMQAEMDFDGRRLTRLDAVKEVFREFVLGNDRGLPGRPDDMIGMIAFARFADTVCPLVRAHDALAEFAGNLRIVQTRFEDGTAIGDAVALAAARLRRAEEDLRPGGGAAGEKDFKIKSKVIIILTDGRYNAGDRTPGEAAELAREWGMRIYSIGIGGGESFVTMQTPLGPVKMASNSGLDEETLKSIAEISGGKYFEAGDAESLRRVYEEIDRLEKSEIEAIEFAQYDENFAPFAAAAGVLLLLETALSATWLRRAP